MHVPCAVVMQWLLRKVGSAHCERDLIKIFSMKAKEVNANMINISVICECNLRARSKAKSSAAKSAHCRKEVCHLRMLKIPVQ